MSKHNLTLRDETTEFLLYTAPNGAIKVEVLLSNETIWLTQKRMAELFGVGVAAISKHLDNIYESGELQREATLSVLETVQQEGARQVTRKLEYYNLDAVISVGYRVNSAQATQFRIWATQLIKEYIIKGFAMDDERLKNGRFFGKDYFRELLELVRMSDYKTIAESNNFIVLDKYSPEWKVAEGYQSESDLERELIQDLVNQGYEFLPTLNTPQALLANVRVQLQALNSVQFAEGEWARFVETWLDKPSDGIVDKTRKIHDDYIHDFVFDDGRIQNIYLLDKKNITRNKVQVIKQFEQAGSHANRYDVTILVNGLPLVQVELKKRGVAIREAFNQVHRYSKESFNSEHSLFKYLQLFVISNGTDSRYFANTTQRNKNSFDFTMNWAKADNTLIKDLKDFTATFFQKHTLLNVLLHYSVFDVSDTLLVMRPYQIAATERILWKIKSAYQAKSWSSLEGGGFIWHTTGSGKTLTSFKAARLATELDFIDKVFFVVDRKDLDYQTMKEYQRFSRPTA
jgi:hypothetical protein